MADYLPETGGTSGVIAGATYYWGAACGRAAPLDPDGYDIYQFTGPLVGLDETTDRLFTAPFNTSALAYEYDPATGAYGDAIGIGCGFYSGSGWLISVPIVADADYVYYAGQGGGSGFVIFRLDRGDTTGSSLVIFSSLAGVFSMSWTVSPITNDIIGVVSGSSGAAFYVASRDTGVATSISIASTPAAGPYGFTTYANGFDADGNVLMIGNSLDVSAFTRDGTPTVVKFDASTYAYVEHATLSGEPWDTLGPSTNPNYVGRLPIEGSSTWGTSYGGSVDETEYAGGASPTLLDWYEMSNSSIGTRLGSSDFADAMNYLCADIESNFPGSAWDIEVYPFNDVLYTFYPNYSAGVSFLGLNVDVLDSDGPSFFWMCSGITAGGTYYPVRQRQRGDDKGDAARNIGVSANHPQWDTAMPRNVNHNSIDMGLGSGVLVRSITYLDPCVL